MKPYGFMALSIANMGVYGKQKMERKKREKDRMMVITMAKLCMAHANRLGQFHQITLTAQLKHHNNLQLTQIKTFIHHKLGIVMVSKI